MGGRTSGLRLMRRPGLALLLMIVLAAMTACGVPARVEGLLDTTPEAWFARVTGLDLPADARLLADIDGHDFGEGATVAVWEVDADGAADLLAAPSTLGPWQPGPVETGDMWGGIVADLEPLVPDPNALVSLRSDSVVFAAEERCCSDRGSLEWWNASVVVVDENRGRVSLVVWDY